MQGVTAFGEHAIDDVEDVLVTVVFEEVAGVHDTVGKFTQPGAGELFRVVDHRVHDRQHSRFAVAAGEFGESVRRDVECGDEGADVEADLRG